MRPRTVAPWDSAQSSITTVPAIAQLQQAIHVHGVAEEVDGQDRPRAFADEPLEEIEVHVPRLGLGVDRHDRGPVVANGAGGGDVGARRHETSSPLPMPAAATAS